jgi:hypothetical protein
VKDAPGPAPAPARVAGITLRCTYCHGALEATVHCAGCLAPHHADCFAAHGRCSAPGCGARDVVKRGARAAWLSTALLLINMAATLTVVFVPRMGSPIPEPPPLAALSVSGPSFQSDHVEALVASTDVAVPVVLSKWSRPFFQSLVAEATSDATHVSLVEGWEGQASRVAVLVAAPGDRVTVTIRGERHDLTPAPGERAVLSLDGARRTIVRRVPIDPVE